MAKVISCRDVGVDCDFVARGETVEEVLRACAAHGKEAHGMDQIPPELAKKVQAAIREQ
jgi:predicted small metal-binding protein